MPPEETYALVNAPKKAMVSRNWGPWFPRQIGERQGSETLSIVDQETGEYSRARPEPSPEFLE